MRVQEMGGTVGPPTALSRARQVQREAELIADQNAFFRDQRWIETNIHGQLKALMVRVAEIAAEINQELGMRIEARTDVMRCILRASGVCMNVAWRQAYQNVVTDQAALIAAEFNGHLFLPTERMMTVFPPAELRRTTIVPALSLSRDVRWQEQGKPGAHPLPADDVAQLIVSKFLNLVGRAHRGEITRTAA